MNVPLPPPDLFIQEGGIVRGPWSQGRAVELEQVTYNVFVIIPKKQRWWERIVFFWRKSYPEIMFSENEVPTMSIGYERYRKLGVVTSNEPE